VKRTFSETLVFVVVGFTLAVPFFAYFADGPYILGSKALTGGLMGAGVCLVAETVTQLSTRLLKPKVPE
jgi:hypothetical protein